MDPHSRLENEARPRVCDTSLSGRGKERSGILRYSNFRSRMTQKQSHHFSLTLLTERNPHLLFFLTKVQGLPLPKEV